MGGLHVEEEIGRPVEEVWEALTDWGRMSQWMVTGDLRPQGSGPVGEGTIVAFAARGGEHQSEIVGWEPPKRLAI